VNEDHLLVNWDICKPVKVQRGWLQTAERHISVEEIFSSFQDKVFICKEYEYRGADKSLTQPGRK